MENKNKELNENETKEIENKVIYYVYNPITFKLICNVDWEIVLDHKTTIEPPLYNAAFECPYWNNQKSKWDIKVIDEDQKILTEILDGKYNLK